MKLKKYGVSVPYGGVAFTVEQAIEIAKDVYKVTGFDDCVIKAQIHAGGRGKAGGVKIASSLDEVKSYSETLLGSKLITPQTSIEGKLVRKILIEQNIYYNGNNQVKEFYFSITLNRSKKRLSIVYSPCGGIDIETVACNTPHKIYKEEINPLIGLQNFQCRKIAFNLKLSGQAYNEMINFITNAYKAYNNVDATLLEINPLVKTSDDHIYATDCKLVIDNNALFRQPDIVDMRDTEEEDPIDVEANKLGLNFIKLNGNCGCMVNGAGLAMATMDMIKQSGGEPANFLDVGGTADSKRIEEGFKLILKDKNVKAILVNIFGGIVRCDRVARGLSDALNNIKNIEIPIIVRLQGTNSKEGAEIIKQSGLKVYYADTLNEAANLVKQILNKIE